MTTCKQHQYCHCYPLVALRVRDTTRRQSDLQCDTVKCETTPICLQVTVTCVPAEYITRCHRCTSPTHAHTHEPISFHGRAEAHLCRASIPPLAASGGMDGGARGCNGRIVLHWRRNWLCSLGQLHRHLREPCDREELALMRFEKGRLKRRWGGGIQHELIKRNHCTWDLLFPTCDLGGPAHLARGVRHTDHHQPTSSLRSVTTVQVKLSGNGTPRRVCSACAAVVFHFKQ